jgi:protein-S-isoprenylcysteine O-methyltransferase Ste14
MRCDTAKNQVQIECAMTNLNTRAWFSLAVVVLVKGLLVFIPAGTLSYWQAWVYLSIFTGASILTTLYLIRHDPALLERRMKGGPMAERQPTQKLIMLGASVGFVGLLVVPALDVRFGWSAMSPNVVLLGDALLIAGFYFIWIVYRENTFTSATIEVAKDQKVVSTGPYAVVRHPMYAGGLLYLLAMPLALGSYWGLVVFAVVLLLVLWRLFDEERFLSHNLPGYTEYQQRVRHRLVPFVW